MKRLLPILLLAACQPASPPAPVAPPPAQHQAQGAAPATGRTAQGDSSDGLTEHNPGFNQKDVPPNFTLPYLANGKGSLSLHDLVGPNPKAGVDAVIVSFVASWCGNCRASYPTLQALEKQYGGKLKVLLLTAENDDEGKLREVALLKEDGITLPLLDAPEDVVELWLGTKRNIPRMYLLDYKGMVRVKDTGFGKKMAKMLPEQVAWLMKRREAEKQGG